MWDVCSEFVSFFLVTSVTGGEPEEPVEPKTISDFIRTFSQEELFDGQQVHSDYR
jgi:hypothetical protein